MSLFSSKLGNSFFIFDTIIEPLNVSNGKSINKTELNANIDVKDNLVLDDVAIKVDGKDTKVKNDGEIYTVNIKESASKQNLVITAIDKAGNKTLYKVDDLIVSTNVFVRLFNNTILFAAAVFGLLVVLSLTVGLVLKSKSGVVNVKTSSKK
jgi:ABC-type sugar transport system permease subunit